MTAWAMCPGSDSGKGVQLELKASGAQKGEKRLRRLKRYDERHMGARLRCRAPGTKPAEQPAVSPSILRSYQRAIV